MESYLDFADVYDELMDQVPYELWKNRIIDAINEYGITKPMRTGEIAEGQVTEEEILESERNLVVDLGCGTGTLAEMLYAEGYDMIGVDSSEAMLEKAMDKRYESGSEILYLNQDMRDLELYSTVGTVLSVCDSINYIVDTEELKTVFSLVHNYLYPGGLFIFDFNTVFKYSEIIGDSTIAENREDCSFIWDNFYDPETHINEYDLTLYIQSEGDLFRRIEETHIQRGYDKKEIEKLLLDTGFEILVMKDSDSEDSVHEETERVYVVARCLKENK